MAENWLQFAEAIEDLTPEEELWLRRELEIVYVGSDGRERVTDDDPAAADRSPWHGCRFLRDVKDYDGSCEIGFNYAFRADGSLSLYAEEYGEPEQVAHLAQKFLRQFRQDTAWALAYACVGSKMRPGEFGGGAIFVTAEAVTHLSLGEWLEQQRAAWRPQSRNALSQ